MRGILDLEQKEFSKPMNMGNLVRSAHAFGAQFVLQFLLIILSEKENLIRQKHQTIYHGMTGINLKR